MSEKLVFLGVDPGKAGFIAAYDNELDELSFYPMPEHKIPTGKKLKSGKDEMKTEFHPEGFRQLIIN